MDAGIRPQRCRLGKPEHVVHHGKLSPQGLSGGALGAGDRRCLGGSIFVRVEYLLGGFAFQIKFG
jgi:hypothetical protein